MGRKKISITRIQDERNRQITFSKRKSGLLKKAYELSILCDVEIAVIMITSNRKLYQYASSNMNSILIRYTEFKDPDENKTNADILDDITKKERGGPGNDDSGDEDGTSFLLTPRTQENYRKIDEEFDHMLQQNQVPPSRSAPTPLGSAPATTPQIMPVTVPVSKSVQQQIHQHLLSQKETQQRSALGSSSSGHMSSAPLSSASVSSAFMSPQSELSSASPLNKERLLLGNMPPPMNTPTRVQTIRNQTLKLHLPGSGRSYIPLATGGSLSAGSHSDGEGKKSAGPGGDDLDASNKAGGSKPQLRVYIPGQKEFVPRTQATSPLPQVSLPAPTTTTTQATTTTAVDSLTTPVLSLQTPNMFSNLPPMFSSFLGEFPFGSQTPGSTTHTAATGGGGGDSSSAALVAFPVSIQPSAGGTGPGNLVLHAQNMGQPFLLTPSVDGRQNPLQGLTPPSSGLSTGLSPNMKDFEQLKAQYERTQQLIHQQLLLSQMQSMLHQQTSRATPVSGSQTVSSPTVIRTQQVQDMDSGLGTQETEAERYINGADVMMGGEGGRGQQGEEGEPLAKRSRLDNSPGTTQIVQV